MKDEALPKVVPKAPVAGETSDPIRPPWRTLKAYLVTLVVVVSYLWLRIRRRHGVTALREMQMRRIHRRNARRIYRGIVELQGLYIKVGQLLSIMTNFLPEEFRSEFSALQDKVPPRPYEDIERRFRDEFDGKGPDELFASFARQPMASASIGQVHLATLADGQRVAVKVQYPDIEHIVRADLVALRRIFGLLHRLVPRHGLDVVYREIREMVLQELDFLAEAKSTEAIAAHFVGRENVRFPSVVHERTTSRVLTTEFVQGVKINDLAGLQRLAIDRRQLARLVIECYCEQIFRHGHYHADPHPGNILVTEGPTIHFIDFGAVAELSPASRQGLITLVQGAINRDTAKITRALHELGFLAHTADPKVYDNVVEYFHRRLQQELKLDSFNLKDLRFDPEEVFEKLADLRAMDISLADLSDTFRVPKEWIMLERTILLLMGLCTELDPTLNPTDIIRPHVEAFVLGEDGDWSRIVLDTGRDVALSLVSLPNELRTLATRATRGELRVSVTGTANTARLYYTLGHQVIYTALGISCGLVALHFHERGAEVAADLAASTAGVFGLLLLKAFVRGRRLLRRTRRR